VLLKLRLKFVLREVDELELRGENYINEIASYIAQQLVTGRRYIPTMKAARRMAEKKSDEQGTPRLSLAPRVPHSGSSRRWSERSLSYDWPRLADASLRSQPWSARSSSADVRTEELGRNLRLVNKSAH